jgi:hypothetical protein
MDLDYTGSRNERAGEGRQQFNRLTGQSESEVVVRQSPASKEANLEAEESTTLEAVRRQRLVKT